MERHRSLSVIIAAFNEQDALPAMHERLAAVLATLDLDTHVLYVDDGSRDQTWAVLESLAAHDPRVGLLRLSRNFGKELALTAEIGRAACRERGCQYV